MSDRPNLTPPESQDNPMEPVETAVRQTARHFAYPPTPDIAGKVRARLTDQPRRGLSQAVRLALAALLALAVVTLAVPETRAFVLEALRIGVVRIFFGEAPATSTPSQMPPPTGIPSALDLPGATTLADAERQLGSQILLPTYPADLGAPDQVYAQRIGSGVVVTLAWLETDDPAQIDLLLQILDTGASASKYFPQEARNQREVTVNGRRAVWLTDVHQLFFFDGRDETSRLVDKDVLLWEVGDLTYRLETNLPLNEAIRVAESLR